MIPEARRRPARGVRRGSGGRVMSEIQRGSAVARIDHRETMKGRVRRPPRFGQASVYWVNRLRASSVRLDFLVPISDAELAIFLDSQEKQKHDAWQAIKDDEGDRPFYASIGEPATVPQFVLNFIRTGRDSG